MKILTPTINYFQSVYSELKKVNFPSRKQTFRRTVVVIAVVLFLAVILGLFDAGITQLLKIFILERGV